MCTFADDGNAAKAIKWPQNYTILRAQLLLPTALTWLSCPPPRQTWSACWHGCRFMVRQVPHQRRWRGGVTVATIASTKANVRRDQSFYPAVPGTYMSHFSTWQMPFIQNSPERNVVPKVDGKLRRWALACFPSLRICPFFPSLFIEASFFMLRLEWPVLVISASTAFWQQGWQWVEDRTIDRWLYGAGVGGFQSN